MLDFVGTALAVIIGGVITLAADHLHDRREDRRQAEERAAERADQEHDAQKEFQRRTLLEVQEASQTLARAMGRAHSQDLMNARNAGGWTGDLLTDELNQELLEAGTGLLLHASRVRDPHVRALTAELKRLNASQATVPSESASWKLMLDTTRVIERLHDRVGRLLRGELPLLPVTDPEHDEASDERRER